MSIEGTITGVRNVYFAYMKDDGTYDTPKKISDTMTVSLKPTVATGSLAGDNAIRKTVSKLTKITLTTELNEIPLEDKATMYGHKYEKGQELVTLSDVAPYMAVGFEYTKDNGASRYVWLYKGKAQPYDVSTDTDGVSIKFATPSITFEFVYNDEGNIKYTLDTDSQDYLKEKAEKWFNEVQTFEETSTP